MSFNPINPIKYVGSFYQNVASYTRQRDPTTADLFPKENQGKYPVISLWSNNVLNKIWGLVNIVNNQAIWILFATGNGGPVLQFTTDSGASPVFPNATDGNVALNGITGGGVTTIGAANQVQFTMQTPFSLSPFTFTQQVGIQTTASNNPLNPLQMINNLPGNYGPVIQNTSTADLTTTSIAIFNSVDNIQMGMASTGYVTNPILQGRSFFQSTSGMVWSCVDAADPMLWYIGGMQAMTLTATAGTPILQIFNGYVELANQSKINSVQIADLSVPNGGSANVVVIGSEQQWMFFASTNTNTPDTTYRAAATVRAGSSFPHRSRRPGRTWSRVGC